MKGKKENEKAEKAEEERISLKGGADQTPTLGCDMASLPTPLCNHLHSSHNFIQEDLAQKGEHEAEVKSPAADAPFPSSNAFSHAGARGEPREPDPPGGQEVLAQNAGYEAEVKNPAADTHFPFPNAFSHAGAQGEPREPDPPGVQDEPGPEIYPREGECLATNALQELRDHPPRHHSGEEAGEDAHPLRNPQHQLRHHGGEQGEQEADHHLHLSQHQLRHLGGEQGLCFAVFTTSYMRW